MVLSPWTERFLGLPSRRVGDISDLHDLPSCCPQYSLQGNFQSLKVHLIVSNAHGQLLKAIAAQQQLYHEAGEALHGHARSLEAVVLLYERSARKTASEAIRQANAERRFSQLWMETKLVEGEFERCFSTSYSSCWFQDFSLGATQMVLPFSTRPVRVERKRLGALKAWSTGSECCR